MIFFFYKESKSKKNFCFFGGWRGWAGGFTMNPNLKKKSLLFVFIWWGMGDPNLN